MNFTDVANQSRASIEKEDLKVLLPLVAAINPQYILEIGMHQGYSMEVWKKAFMPRLLIGVEKDSPTLESYIEGLSMMYWNTDSHDPKSMKYPSGIDFLFIDGDHSLEGVTKDFGMYSPLVKTGGIIAFHDVLHFNKDPEVNVKPLWEKLKLNYPYVEIKVGPNSTGLGVIYV